MQRKSVAQSMLSVLTLAHSPLLQLLSKPGGGVCLSPAPFPMFPLKPPLPGPFLPSDGALSSLMAALAWPLLELTRLDWSGGPGH